MSNPSQDELYPKHLVLPHYTDAQRNALLADVGTLIYNSTDDEIDFCTTKAAGAANWHRLSSVEES